MRTFRAILSFQWSRARVATALLSLVAFGFPAFIVGQRYVDATDNYMRTQALLQASEYVGRAFPLLALGVGLVFGVLAWADDQRANHVYALSLPQSRERYVLMKFLAAGAHVLIPVLALYVGALIASRAVALPRNVHAYPGEITVRFLLAALSCYSVFFALSIATRRAARILAVVLVLIVAGELVSGMFVEGFSLVSTILDGITTWPSPFALLTGRWSLFDV